MRAVLDTNIFVSATLIKDGNEDRILRAWQRGHFELILSQEILKEVGAGIALPERAFRRSQRRRELSIQASKCCQE